MNIKVEIKNADAINRAFSLAPQIMFRNLQIALKASAIDIQRAARRLAPHKTGYMKSRIEYRPFSSLSYVVEPMANYSYFVHEGTRFMRARPFLSDAAEFEQGFVDAEFEKAVEDTLETIARKAR